MRKRHVRHLTSKHARTPVAWLPVDSRIFPFLAFSHVRGIARIFLTIEIVLSVIMVIGTCLLVIITSLR